MTKKRIREKTLKKELLDQLENNLPDLQQEDIQESINLNDITEYYHKQLYSSKKAKSYLEKLKLFTPELLTRFKIGFCNGSLKDKLSKKQYASLSASGLVKGDTEQEKFLNCITFPVLNNLDQVSGIYGININDNKTVSHGDFNNFLFNEKALKVYDEILLCNNILDALALINSGLENVVSLKDSDFFSADHIKTFYDNRIKQIIIAYDNTNPLASDLLITIFEAEEFRIKKISPPYPSTGQALKPHLRWLEAVNADLDKNGVMKLIDKSDVFIKEEKKDFSAEKQNGYHIFEIGDIKYKITGVKDIFVSDLRVNIKAEYNDEAFPDNVNLYSARSRTSFSSNLSNMFALEPKRIEKDLLKIIDYLEDERDKKIDLKDDDTSQVELTDDEKQLGLDFLGSPDLFDQIIGDMASLGYVGEDLNKLLVYLCASSRKLDDPIHVLIISQSASGKSYLLDTLRKLIPPEDLVFIISLSDQALNYLPDLLNKFIIFGEFMHSEIIEHQIREMLSSKELTRLVVQKDDKTGRMESKLIKKKVIVSSVMTTTTYKINPENASRYFIINADESKEQTKRIHEEQRLKYTLERQRMKNDVIPWIIKKHMCAQRMLKKVNIVNNFARHLDFPDINMRTRRDHDRFIDLIAGVCFLRQYQKVLKKDKDTPYIECDLEDYKTAYDIMVNGVLASTMTELPKGSILLYEEIRKMVKQTAKERKLKPEEVSFIQREIREFTKLGAEFIKKHIRILVEYEYIVNASGKNKGTRYSYRLRQDEEINEIDLSVIPSPEKMGKIIKKENN